MPNKDMVSLSKSQQLLLALIKLNKGIDDKVVLAKLEYFADFIHYAFNNQTISDQSNIYTRQDHGPLSRSLSNDLEVLKLAGLITEDKAYSYKMKQDVKIELTPSELKTIHYVIEKYGNSSWVDLRRISHEQAPYLSTMQGGIVEPFTAYNLIDEYPDYETYNPNLS